jgi:hypothetical protein
VPNLYGLTENSTHLLKTTSGILVQRDSDSNSRKQHGERFKQVSSHISAKVMLKQHRPRIHLILGLRL